MGYAANLGQEKKEPARGYYEANLPGPVLGSEYSHVVMNRFILLLTLYRPKYSFCQLWKVISLTNMVWKLKLDGVQSSAS